MLCSTQLSPDLTCLHQIITPIKLSYRHHQLIWDHRSWPRSWQVLGMGRGWSYCWSRAEGVWSRWNYWGGTSRICRFWSPSILAGVYALVNILNPISPNKAITWSSGRSHLMFSLSKYLLWLANKSSLLAKRQTLIATWIFHQLSSGFSSVPSSRTVSCL